MCLDTSRLDQQIKNLPVGRDRSPVEGHGSSLQHSRLENPADRGVWQELQSTGSQRVRHDWATDTFSPLGSGNVILKLMIKQNKCKRLPVYREGSCSLYLFFFFLSLCYISICKICQDNLLILFLGLEEGWEFMGFLEIFLSMIIKIDSM